MDVDATEHDSTRTRDGRYAVSPVRLLVKASPHTEGDQRFVYCEPSNENVDGDGERILQKALVESREDFLKFGNVDIEHLSLLGHRLGLKNPAHYQIGHPIEVGDTTPLVVKAVIYSGDGPHCEQANFFWKSLTAQQPPRRWYPSVGGQTLARDPDDPSTVTRVRWTNLAFAREPVNRTVKGVSLFPPATFAKAIIAAGGADTATLTGGAALRRESLHPTTVSTLPGQLDDAAYRRAADAYINDLVAGRGCVHAVNPDGIDSLTEHFSLCAGMLPDSARISAERLARELTALIQPHNPRREAA